MKKVISDKIKAILQASTHSSDINAIANELQVSVQVVAGSLKKIKQENLATYADHKLVITKEGLGAINVTAKKVKNKDLVAALVQGQIDGRAPTKEEHKELVELIANTLGKSKVDARVYLYNYEKAAGLRA